MAELIKLKCKQCGGELEVSEGQEMLYCPYCGSKTLVLESNKVKIERIRKEAEIEEIKLNNEKFTKNLIIVLIMFAIFIGYGIFLNLTS